MPASSKTSITASLSEMASTWEAYKKSCSQEERDKLVSIMASADTATPAGLNDLLMKLILAEFAGVVSPAVVHAAMPLIEMLADNIHMLNARSPAGRAGQDIALTVMELRARAAQLPVFSSSFAQPEREKVLVGSTPDEEGG